MFSFKVPEEILKSTERVEVTSRGFEKRYRVEPEIDTWLRTCVRGRYEILNTWSSRYYYHHRITFEDERDAALFKLTYL